jgi:hypothetical protein
MDKINLARRCFDNSFAHDELFDTAQVYLGGKDSEQCLQPDFVWMVYNASTDYYDCSAEIILSEHAPEITREIADKFLSLGFSQIYFSCEGKMGDCWTTTSRGVCSSRKADERDIENHKLRAHLKAANDKIDCLEKRLGELFSLLIK